MHELNNIQWIMLAALKLVKIIIFSFVFWFVVFLLVGSIYVYF